MSPRRPVPSGVILSLSPYPSSVPCPPTSVVMEQVCSNNMAHVTWAPVAGADSYLVQAFGVEEHFVQCETQSRACTLLDLLCGFTYNVTVLAINSVCNVSESAVTVLPPGESLDKSPFTAKPVGSLAL